MGEHVIRLNLQGIMIIVTCLAIVGNLAGFSPAFMHGFSCQAMYITVVVSRRSTAQALSLRCKINNNNNNNFLFDLE